MQRMLLWQRRKNIVEVYNCRHWSLSAASSCLSAVNLAFLRVLAYTINTRF